MFIFFLFIISDHKRTFDERRLLQNHAGLAIRPIKSVGRRPESTWNGWWKEGNCQFAAGDSYFAVGDGVEREREGGAFFFLLYKLWLSRQHPSKLV